MVERCQRWSGHFARRTTAPCCTVYICADLVPNQLRCTVQYVPSGCERYPLYLRSHALRPGTEESFHRLVHLGIVLRYQTAKRPTLPPIIRLSLIPDQRAATSFPVPLIPRRSNSKAANAFFIRKRLCVLPTLPLPPMAPGRSANNLRCVTVSKV